MFPSLEQYFKSLYSYFESFRLALIVCNIINRKDIDDVVVSPIKIFYGLTGICSVKRLVIKNSVHTFRSMEYLVFCKSCFKLFGDPSIFFICFLQISYCALPVNNFNINHQYLYGIGNTML